MHNRTTKWILLIIISITVLSCKKLLDKPPQKEYSDPVVWNDLPLIQTFVDSINHDAMGFPFAIIRLSDLSDESFFPPDWGTHNFNQCKISANNLAGWDYELSPQTIHFLWASMYSNVRKANLFFSKIDALKTDEHDWVTHLKGEVYFLRGWTYASLVNMYGGVPIITKAYEVNDNFDVARNSYEDCMNFIVGQLDSAAKYLPVEYTDANLAGRSTKGAALAFKSRVLLYAASDLHNPLKKRNCFFRVSQS
jgi:starch-binding outer membrane protein, SusD/RagB family